MKYRDNNMCWLYRILCCCRRNNTKNEIKNYDAVPNNYDKTTYEIKNYDTAPGDYNKIKNEIKNYDTIPNDYDKTKYEYIQLPQNYNDNVMYQTYDIHKVIIVRGVLYGLVSVDIFDPQVRLRKLRESVPGQVY